MKEVDTIEIFFPTFRNKTVFQHSLISCLEQDYQNVLIHIYDNSIGDDCNEIWDFVRQLNDTRLRYHPNKLNVGPMVNYAQIIDHMKTSEFAIFLSADMGLEKCSLSIMMAEMLKGKSQVVYPSSNIFAYEENYGMDLMSKKYFGVVDQGLNQSQAHGIEIIREYFSNLNISGEYYNFSFAGSLIYAPILKALSSDYLAFRFHGMEHFLSMELALNASNVTRLNRPCLRVIVGAPRIGGTQRPGDFFTRLEPIVACQRFLRKYELVLSRNIPAFDDLYQSQIDKCQFFVKNYSGFDNEIRNLIREIEYR